MEKTKQPPADCLRRGERSLADAFMGFNDAKLRGKLLGENEDERRNNIQQLSTDKQSLPMHKLPGCGDVIMGFHCHFLLLLPVFCTWSVSNSSSSMS